MTTKYKEEDVDLFLKKLEELCFWLHMAKKTITEEEYSKKTIEFQKLIRDFKREK